MSKSILPENQYQFVKVLASLKSSQKPVFDVLYKGLSEFLEPAMMKLIRCAPADLQVMQGRAQIAEEMLRCAANCTELAEGIKQVETAKTPQNGGPPRFDTPRQGMN